LTRLAAGPSIRGSSGAIAQLGNRFYQVPHCTGLGHLHPRAEARLRGVKAEGGWGVVCTQEVEVHPSSEISPYLEGRLWDDNDIPAHALMTDAVHAQGSLAGIELVHNGLHAPNLTSRVPPMAPSARPVDAIHPVQARAMTQRDIREFRQWHVAAAKRARRAGYDIVYVYAGHGMSTLMHFLMPRFNQRSDDYGGSVRNRLRLLEETLIDVRSAVGDQCAVALRLAVDELSGAAGLQASDEAIEIVSHLAELPDLWDVNVSDWSNDSATARFAPDEGYQEPYTKFVKQLVSTPVVGVGRFTSPTAMVSQIRRGVLDFIGAARPSIADPFLPNKIRDGELDAIRECIGCNICVSSDNVVAPIRCTQNPTMGEEWKRAWHPEVMPTTSIEETVLIVGAGPAGLECALQASRQGFSVLLAEAGDDVGGRLLGECRLPGLASYRRVRDYRYQQLLKASNVEILLHNRLSAEDIVDSAIEQVFIATGSHWRRDGFGRQHPIGFGESPKMPCYTPDDIIEGQSLEGHVLVYDDDHYLMGAAMAEYLLAMGVTVSYMTPASEVSAWTVYTLEQEKIHQRLANLGIDIYLGRALQAINREHCEHVCVYTGKPATLLCDAVISVTARQVNDTIAAEVQRLNTKQTVHVIGDCLAPSTVAAAVY